MKHKPALKPVKHVVLFVEGDTDFVFFTALMNFYNEKSKTKLCFYEIQNIKGVSKYSSSKLLGKLKNEIMPKANRDGRAVQTVICDYDTDVDENPVGNTVNWVKVRRGVCKLGIKRFYLIKVKSSIEDWLLDDLDGLCGYLRISPVLTEINGDSGNKKIQNLFKRENRIYLKGKSIKDFIDKLDIAVIRKKRKDSLKELEKELNVNL